MGLNPCKVINKLLSPGLEGGLMRFNASKVLPSRGQAIRSLYESWNRLCLSEAFSLDYLGKGQQFGSASSQGCEDVVAAAQSLDVQRV